MYRFKSNDSVSLDDIIWFKYIICVGSSYKLFLSRFLYLLFQYIICVDSRLNINGKAVALKKFQYIICVGSSDEDYANYTFFAKFQYIICVGSRKNGVYYSHPALYGFNTSYVSVQDGVAAIIDIAID